MHVHILVTKYCTTLSAQICKLLKLSIIEHAPMGLLCLVSAQVIYSCMEGQSSFSTRTRSLELLKGLTNAGGTAASLKMNTEAQI